MAKRMPYAYICEACQHPASEHALTEEGDLRAGPYECPRCDCTIAQDAPMYGVDRRQFEELFPDRLANEESTQ
jgi:hypothetical protein